jgi:hypothetical protein
LEARDGADAKIIQASRLIHGGRWVSVFARDIGTQEI